ncbi:hypothetical protein [Alienimonas californiensis]|uniref:hypothetical protein n=1 Tax=Alienimonas californiensis TaxID=2527989 RepID=UPI00119F2F12|nr:hypothetical protein [Alienimonas californiensis]
MSRPAALSPGVYVAVQVAVVLLVALLLGWFSPAMVRPESLPRVGPLLEPDGFLARTFCAWAFLLAYGAVRLAIWAVRLFLAGDDAEFADIRADWEEALGELDRVGLSLREAPLFLVIGLGRAEETRFFAAAAREWQVVSPPPTKTSAALRVYADPDGVYVSCSNVGAAAAQRDLKPAPASSAFGGSAGGGADSAAAATIAPGDGVPVVPPPRGGGGLGAGGADDHEDLGQTVAPGGQDDDEYGATIAPGAESAGFPSAAPSPRAPALRVPPPPPPLPPPAVRLLDEPGRVAALRRTEYLCERIARERGELCPANGALLAIPLAWSNPTGLGSAAAEGASSLPRALADDLSAAAAVWGLTFPACVTFTGLDRLRGASELVARGERMAPGFALGRAGTRFPSGRAVDERTVQWAAGKLCGWFDGWIDRALAEGLPSGPLDPTADRNGQLVQLATEVRRRGRNFSGQLQTAAGAGLHGGMPRLAGVYCCGTGGTEEGTAFVAGLLRRLEDVQDWVAWRPGRLAADRRRTVAAYLLLALAVVLLVVAGLSGLSLIR